MQRLISTKNRGRIGGGFNCLAGFRRGIGRTLDEGGKRRNLVDGEGLLRKIRKKGYDFEEEGVGKKEGKREGKTGEPGRAQD